jgi:hypothetical protein
MRTRAAQSDVITPVVSVGGEEAEGVWASGGDQVAHTFGRQGPCLGDREMSGLRISNIIVRQMFQTHRSQVQEGRLNTTIEPPACEASARKCSGRPCPCRIQARPSL